MFGIHDAAFPVPRGRGRGPRHPLLRRGRRLPGLRPGDGLPRRPARTAGGHLPGELLAVRRDDLLPQPDVAGPRSPHPSGVGRPGPRGRAGGDRGRAPGLSPTGAPRLDALRAPAHPLGPLGEVQGRTSAGPGGSRRSPGRRAGPLRPGQRRLAGPRRALRGPGDRKRRTLLARVAGGVRPAAVRPGARPGGSGRRSSAPASGRSPRHRRRLELRAVSPSPAAPGAAGAIPRAGPEALRRHADRALAPGRLGRPELPAARVPDGGSPVADEPRRPALEPRGARSPSLRGGGTRRLASARRRPAVPPRPDGEDVRGARRGANRPPPRIRVPVGLPGEPGGSHAGGTGRGAAVLLARTSPTTRSSRSSPSPAPISSTSTDNATPTAGSRTSTTTRSTGTGSSSTPSSPPPRPTGTRRRTSPARSSAPSPTPSSG